MNLHGNGRKQGEDGGPPELGAKAPGKGGRYRFRAFVLATLFAAAAALALFAQNLPADEEPPLIGGGYAGSASCKKCHEKQYERYMEFSRKSRSYEAILRMQDGLTEEEKEECFQCHTTGYGKRTGFTSIEETPYLKDVGCESCHGPGKLHTDTMDMAHIVKTVTIDVCEGCHVHPKVKSFRYKSVIYAGAH